MPSANPIVFTWWLCVVAIAGYYTGASLTIWWMNRRIVPAMYALAFGSLTLMASISVAVRANSPFDPYVLVAIQRAMYAPLLFALAVLVDRYIAMHYGNRTLAKRLLLFLDVEQWRDREA